jgi:hypothetical protein
MFSNPDFLSTLGVGLGVGVATAFWLTRSMPGALRELQQSGKLIHFWTAVIQVCAVMLPVAAVMFVQASRVWLRPEVEGPAVVASACAGALLAALLAAAVVAWATSEVSATGLSTTDYSENRQLLYRMREFRAHELVRSAAEAKAQPA